MKFIAEREHLLSALSFAAKYAETRDRIPIINMMKFEADGDRVSVTATDLDRAAKCWFSAHVERAGSTCLPGHLLLKAVKSTDASEVQIDAKEKGASIQIGATTRMKLATLPSGDFPDLSMLSGDGKCQFELPAEILARHKSEVAFAELRDLRTDIWATGTFWEVDGSNLNLVATNRKMLSRITIQAPSADIPRAIVPTIDLPEWDEPVCVVMSDSFIRYSCGRQVVSTKLIDAKFPDYQHIIPGNPTKLAFDRAQLLAAVNRMALISKKVSPVVILVGRDGKAYLEAQFYPDQIADEVPYEGNDFQIAVSHGLLAPVLSSFSCETIEIRYADHTVAPTIHDPSDETRLAVVWPYNDARLVAYLSKQEAAE